MWQVKLEKICVLRKIPVLNVSEIRELLIKLPLEKLSSPELRAPLRPTRGTTRP